MTSFPAILAILLQLWPAKSLPPAEAERALAIAGAVYLEAAEAAPDSVLGARELAAATLVVWHQETRYAADVHAGERGKWGSDDGRAKCLGQLHVSGLVPLGEWQKLGGTDLEATRRCARATMRVLSAHARSCGRGNPEAWFSSYGTGRGCRVRAFGAKRARMWRRVMA